VRVAPGSEHRPLELGADETPSPDPVAELGAEALADSFAWGWLATLCDVYGPRLAAGSPAYDRAAAWALRSLADAVTTEDADRIERLLARGETVRVRWHSEAVNHLFVAQPTVLAEVRGGERPDEILVAGCHFDSWDLGTGAHDDGAGCAVMVGADIGPIVEAGVPGIGHRVHGDRYFDYHHSAADTLDKVKPEDLAANVAAVAGLLWGLASDDQPLPRAGG
jgi:hypothetical protein